MSDYQNGNLGHLYYKEYFKGLTLANKEKITPELANVVSLNNWLYSHILKPEEIEIGIEGNTNIELLTTYPGFISGSGYQHSIGVEGEFKIGFYLDFTFGMPVINGSSVKGAIRAAFPQAHNNNVKYKAEKRKYIKSLLLSLGIEISEDSKIDSLEKEIFDGKDPVGKKLHLYERDLFFDAIIIKGNGKEKFLGEDFITPHKHDTNPALDEFASPNPLQFLKVLPDVKFQFRFQFFNSKVFPELDAEKKGELCKLILLDQGIGAKTNVGYGQFSNTSSSEQPGKTNIETTENGTNIGLKPQINPTWLPKEKLKKNRENEIQAICLRCDSKNNKIKIFKLLVYEEGKEIEVTQSYPSDIIIGKLCMLNVFIDNNEKFTSRSFLKVLN